MQIEAGSKKGVDVNDAVYELNFVADDENDAVALAHLHKLIKHFHQEIVDLTYKVAAKD